MQHQLEDVVLAGWDHTSGSDDVEDTAAAIAGFAGRHGMTAHRRIGTASAIAAVLQQTATGLRGSSGKVTIDAATDGQWLSMMLRGADVREDDDAAALAVADRVEWPDADRLDDRLLLEIAMIDDLRRIQRTPLLSARA
jgi:hypothetical protein